MRCARLPVTHGYDRASCRRGRRHQAIAKSVDHLARCSTTGSSIVLAHLTPGARSQNLSADLEGPAQRPARSVNITATSSALRPRPCELGKDCQSSALPGKLAHHARSYASSLGEMPGTARSVGPTPAVESRSPRWSSPGRRSHVCCAASASLGCDSTSAHWTRNRSPTARLTGIAHLASVSRAMGTRRAGRNRPVSALAANGAERASWLRDHPARRDRGLSRRSAARRGRARRGLPHRRAGSTATPTPSRSPRPSPAR